MNLNPRHIKELIKMINWSPYFRLLSMVIEDIDIGYSMVRMEIEEKHLSPYGAIQGGVYSSLIDTAAYWAPYAELDENVGLISVDVNVNNLASVKEGVLLVKGLRIKTGRSICLAEAEITNQEGKILAHGSSKLLITRDLQTIEQMAALSNNPLPPKFID